MYRPVSFRIALLPLALMCAAASPVLAQTAAPSPLVFEPIPSQFVLAPDFKVTDLDGELGQLAGAYAGRVVDDRLLVGGAGYWLANGSNAFKLAYGGLLLGWSTANNGRIRFGVRALTGVGTATLPIDVQTLRPVFRTPPLVRFGARPNMFPPTTIRLRASDDFFVFEPQGSVGLDMTDHVGITFGAGYRAVAFTDVLRDRIDGPTANLGLEIDW